MNNPVIDEWGTKKWYNSKGLYHRINGPAIEYAGGAKKWLFEGAYHRLDGPAMEFTNGDVHWYIKGQHYTKEEYFKEVSKYISKNELFLLRLKYE